MEVRVENLKRKFKEGKVCCFACAVKKIGLSDDFPQFMKAHGYNEADMTREPAIWEWLQMSRFSISEQVDLRVCIQALDDGPGVLGPPVLHARILQDNDFIPVAYENGNYKIEMGTLQRGQILEIFKNSESYDIVDNVIEKMKHDFIACTPNLQSYSLIPQTLLDSYFTLDFATGRREIGKLENGHIVKSSFYPGYWKDLDVNEQLDDIINSLKDAVRMKLFIVENMFCSQGGIASPKGWIQFLKRCYVHHEDITLVVVSDYMAFSDFFPTKTSVREYINHRLTPNQVGNIFWLDVTSTRYEAPVCAFDSAPKLSLEVRPLTEGCFSTGFTVTGTD